MTTTDPPAPDTPGTPVAPAINTPGVPDVPAINTAGVFDVPAINTAGVFDVPAINTAGVFDVPAINTAGVFDVPAIGAPGTPDVPTIATPQTPEAPAIGAPGAPPSAPARARRAFRRWRRTRPFWAALWTALGGFVIFFLPMAPLGKILQVGVGGVAGMAGGVVIMAMALLVLALPGQRHTAGTIAVIAGVASFPLSNFGGLFLGMALSVLGGAMAFGWLPEKPARRRGLLRRARATDGTSGSPASVGSGTA